MDTQSKKIAFLQSLKPQSLSAEEIVHLLCPLLSPKVDVYSILVKSNLNPLNEPLTIEDVNDFYKNLYTSWHRSLSKLTESNSSAGVVEIVKRYYNTDFLPENMNGEDARDFFENPTNRLFIQTIHPITTIQNKKIFENGILNNLFVHVRPDAANQRFYDCTCRLYINVSPKNALKLGSVLEDMCEKDNVPLYYKIWTKNCDRNDPFLIYTNYDYVQEIVSKIQKIEKTNPDIFAGAKKANPFLAKVDDFIFFGEEPRRDGLSFTKVRAKAITEYLDFYGTLSMFKNQNSLNFEISKENLKIFFEKNGISLEKPFLNLESAKQLEKIEQEKENE